MQHGSRRKNWFNNHYPFGSIVENRSWKGDYRYGFNGVESTNEIANNGNHYEFEFREYNPRNGKFWSVDPLFKEYPWNSTFAFAENIVIWAKDLEGLEAYRTNDGEELGKVGNSNEVREIKLSNDENSLSRDEQIGNLRDMISKANDANSDVSETAKANLFYTSKPTEDAQSGGGMGLGDAFETSIGAAGTYFSVKGNALHNDLYWKGKTTGKFYTTGKYGTTNYLKTRGGYANSYKVVGKPLQAAKSLGTKLGAASLLITGYDMVMGDGLTTSNVLDATFSAAGFIPGVGWAISGSYFLINTGVQLYSGKSIGEQWDD